MLRRRLTSAGLIAALALACGCLGGSRLSASGDPGLDAATDQAALAAAPIREPRLVRQEGRGVRPPHVVVAAALPAGTGGPLRPSLLARGVQSLVLTADFAPADGASRTSRGPPQPTIVV